jgi:hypothetical protein
MQAHEDIPKGTQNVVVDTSDDGTITVFRDGTKILTFNRQPDTARKKKRKISKASRKINRKK